MTNRKLERMFDIYATNLKVLLDNGGLELNPRVDDTVLCPICCNTLFTRKAIETKEITLEHVPPKILGGKERTLTCKNCNNSASPLDTRLHEKLASFDFLKGKIGASSPKDSWFTVNGTKLPVSLSIVEDGVLRIVQRKANPQDQKEVETKMNEGKMENLSLGFSYNTFIDDFSYANLLRIAYLWTFSILGYSFLVNPNLEVIRRQILSPKEKIIPIGGILRAKVPDECLGINLIFKPTELRCFLAVFDVITSNRESYRFSVMLPGPSEPGNTIYDWSVINNDYEISLTNIASPDALERFVAQPFATNEIWANSEHE